MGIIIQSGLPTISVRRKVTRRYWLAGNIANSQCLIIHFLL